MLRALLAIFIYFLLSTHAQGYPNILAIGDSLTEGYQLKESESYPAQLEKLLHKNGHPKAVVVNAGISGATSAIGLSTLKFQLKHKNYDLIIYCLGANDALRGKPYKNTQENIEKAVLYAREKGVRFLLVGMKVPPNYGVKYKKSFDAIYASIAKKYKLDFVPFLLEGVAANKSLNLADGIHPNAKGYQQVAQNVFKATLRSVNKKG